MATVAVQQAATVVGGDVQSNICAAAPDCPAEGGGTGSLLLPLAVIGAAALVIAGGSYINYVVQQSAHVTRPARSPGS